jgi:hypothetical protein
MEDAEDLLALANMPGVRWGTTRTGALTMMEQRAWLEGFAATPNRYCLCTEQVSSQWSVVNDQCLRSGH